MTKLEKIERDVAALSADDLARFREWFEAYDAERFDTTIEDDATNGRLDSLVDAAFADFDAGRTVACKPPHDPGLLEGLRGVAAEDQTIGRPQFRSRKG